MITKLAKFCSTKCSVKRKILDYCIRSMSSTPMASNQHVSSFKMSSVSIEDRQQFASAFPIVVKDLTDSVKHLNIPILTDWYTRLLEYNVPNGKKRRGFSTLLSYKLLEDPEKLTPDNMRLACILAWCTELLTSPFLIIDDILDKSDIRRGVPCWYKLEDVGLTAVNDAMVVENSAYMILRKYFRNHPCYVSMVELFHDMFLKISIGQALDCLTGGSGKPKLELYSMHRYNTIAHHKFACFAFQYPVFSAMYLAGIHDKQLHQEADAVLEKLGYWAQIKNDFLDCFGNMNTNGAILFGDIREGKCAWPVVVALEQATPTQRAVLERCYGQPDDQSVQAVMDVYRELDIPAIYLSYEQETLNNIRNHIERMDPRLPKKMFYNIMQML